MILLKFYFHRYMRYAPSMAILAMFLASFIPVHLATGPFTNTVEEQKLYCGKYWWSAMLMIQNYWNIREVVSYLTQNLVKSFKFYGFFRLFPKNVTLGLLTIIFFNTSFISSALAIVGTSVQIFNFF